jgi:hypothetical protein
MLARGFFRFEMKYKKTASATGGFSLACFWVMGPGLVVVESPLGSQLAASFPARF